MTRVADELVARVDGEELHALLREQRASQLHGGDESEPHMEANHQAEVCAFRAKPVKDQRQREGRHNAGQKRTCIGRAGVLFHFVHPGFVVRVIAHLAYPGICEPAGVSTTGIPPPLWISRLPGLPANSSYACA